MEYFMFYGNEDVNISCFMVTRMWIFYTISPIYNLQIQDWIHPLKCQLPMEPKMLQFHWEIPLNKHVYHTVWG